ncbi:MAG: hypothetical protein WBK77_10720 [Alphaproteobacteria bacterium]
MGKVNKYKIHAALRSEIDAGHVWIDEKSFESLFKTQARPIIKVTNKNNHKSFVCEALQIDKNFLDDYNKKPRITINENENVMVLSKWYRDKLDKLGGVKTKQEYCLEIVSFNCFCGRISSCLLHPMVAVRVGTWLGIISVVLGAIGVVLGILPFLKD